MNAEEIAEIFRQHGEQKQRALIERLRKLGEKTFPMIAEVCEGNYPIAAKRWSVEALGVYPRELSWPLLKVALKSTHMSVRLHAMIAVEALGDPALARSLRPLLKDESGGIRGNALSILARIKPKWLSSAAEEALKDEKVYVRKLAARILAEQE